MRAYLVAAALVAALNVTSVLAQTAAPPAPTAPAPATAAKYSSAQTQIGTLLDDPAARAVLDKYLPSVSHGDQIDMARSMTLKDIQQFAPDVITDQILAQVDADLAKLPAKK
jgi:hypothetical protein